MAVTETSRKLVCTFTDAEGSDINISFKYASEEIEDADVKALITGIVTNGSIYEKTPVSAKSAKVVITSEDDIDIDN